MLLGKRCEYLTGLSFTHNNSYVELEPLRIKPEANVTIVFATTQQDGILIYDGFNEHLAVELFNGRIRVSYNVGNYPVSTMYSFEMVSDGQYHIAELIAIKKNFTLRVDRGLARSIINDGSKDYLKLTTPMYLGGIPPDPGEHAFTDWHLRNLTSFSGCMREVWINHKQVDFGNAKTQQKVQPGCGITEDKSDDELQEDETDDMLEEPPALPPDPCINNKCKHESKCLPNGSGEYSCRCKPGYKGKYCEQVPSKAVEAEHTQNIYGFAPEVTNEADLYPLSNQPALSPSYLTQTAPNDAEPRTAPVVQKSDAQAVEGVKLTFLVPNETESGEHLNGLVVQHIDESEFEHDKKERFVLYHDKQCLLSAFLYFTTITSFVYLALIWIKQRMHVHLDQFQLW
ncbi:hypothetical protein D910_01761 [Dendroctonus ponderosae]|uniref:EGF-like domain-containing protein n=1 Tax=Dendroctonus ponderosae TaxID=77166 RepID=U4TS89_DENPD|nr:hypothetical protein D910_01761 [Dendroctonus ponderosae]